MLRVGIFCDGTRVDLSESLNTGKLAVKSLTASIGEYIKRTFGENYMESYKGWFQGIYADDKITSETGPSERQGKRMKRYFELMKNGYECVFLPMQMNEAEGDRNKEKGIDVALTVAAMNLILTDKLDIMVLVSNDSDYAPLLHNARKHGVRTVYCPLINERKSFNSTRLLGESTHHIDQKTFESCYRESIKKNKVS